MIRRRRFARGCFLITLSLLLALAPVAPAVAGDHPGLVDGSRLLSLRDENTPTVDINLEGPMLSWLSGLVATEDEQAAALIAKIHSVRAIVVELGAERSDEALQQAEQMKRDLERDGWQTLARVREEQSRVYVLVLGSDDAINGLVALIVDAGDGQLVFANVAGHITPEVLEKIASHWSIPGLDRARKQGWNQ